MGPQLQEQEKQTKAESAPVIAVIIAMSWMQFGPTDLFFWNLTVAMAMLGGTGNVKKQGGWGEWERVGVIFSLDLKELWIVFWGVYYTKEYS